MLLGIYIVKIGIFLHDHFIIHEDNLIGLSSRKIWGDHQTLCTSGHV